MVQKDERYNIRVLDRAFTILSLLSDGTPRLLTELSAEAGLNSSTTFRLLSALSYYRFVERDEATGRYQLGIGCLQLARVYLQGSSLRDAALAELQKLRDDTLEAVHLAVLSDMEVVYLEKLEGLRAVGIMSSRVGASAPSHCTGLGKALLAYADTDTVRSHFGRVGLKVFTGNTLNSIDDLMRDLDSIRARGYSFDRGEHEAEVRCVAAPVFDSQGAAIAAISVAGPISRMEPLEGNHDLIDRVREAAAAISARLGYRQLALPPIAPPPHPPVRDGLATGPRKGTSTK
ncbi:MAG TPA: IclR family transcriptional regulator [Chloroflexia bacterium]|nr:IclR family transcriptional regulator [Chloroflexia bacterium]